MGIEGTDPGALYIDREVRIFTGADAEALLAEDSDSHHVDARGGIHSVDRDRWLEAQHCEHRHWFGNEANTADDHNFENARWFTGFESIRNRHFPRAIELGCGPFTNLRIVARTCTIDSYDLLDPLIDQYLGHRNAFYSKDRLSVLAGSTPLYVASTSVSRHSSPDWQVASDPRFRSDERSRAGSRTSRWSLGPTTSSS